MKNAFSLIVIKSLVSVIFLLVLAQLFGAAKTHMPLEIQYYAR